MSLVMWLLGAVVAACGTAVYIELGTVSPLRATTASRKAWLMVRRPQGLPRSGGEKNYLDFIFRRPRFLSICVYAAYALFVVSDALSVCLTVSTS